MGTPRFRSCTPRLCSHMPHDPEAGVFRNPQGSWFPVSHVTLCIQNRDRLRSRRCIDVGDVLPPQRLGSKYRGVASKIGIYVPGAHVSTHLPLAVYANGHKDKKDHTNRLIVTGQHVTILRKSKRGRICTQPLKTAGPVFGSFLKASGEKINHCLEVGIVNLATTNP
jgi:hypothetical protein